MTLSDFIIQRYAERGIVAKPVTPSASGRIAFEFSYPKKTVQDLVDLQTLNEEVRALAWDDFHTNQHAMSSNKIDNASAALIEEALPLASYNPVLRAQI